jgi:hypothetical protein
MYETAKKAREAMKSKARRLASEKYEKVSSSDWTPAEPLNADVKTGARPVSRRAYKSGGKVEGSCGPMRADRKPRKAGGKAENEKAEAKQYAIAKVNRNVKEANEQREGIKHVGGFKNGGRPGKNNGGAGGVGREQDTYGLPPSKIKQKSSGTIESQTPKTPNLPKNPPLPPSRPPEKGMTADEAKEILKGRKDGGRTKKMMGGPMMGGGMPGGPMMDPRMGMVKDKSLDFGGQGITPGVSAMKKGGKVEKHADEAMDKALIKKMVKAEARKGKAGGGMLEASKRAMMVAKDPHNQAKIRPQAPAPKPEDKKDDRVARKDGGGVKSKGKTQINIMISAGGKPDQDQGMMPPLPPGPPGLPGGIPVPVPGGPEMGAAPPPPMPMPMPAAPPMMHGAAPAMGGMPMPRKAGGRVTKVASSYKDMEAGAASGEGRLQKTDIAKKIPKPGLKRGVIVDDNKGYPNKVNGAIGGRTARASGGKTYRSYKDMDAGAGSGKGRLEKTEIEAHKK